MEQYRMAALHSECEGEKVTKLHWAIESVLNFFFPIDPLELNKNGWCLAHDFSAFYLQQWGKDFTVHLLYKVV